MITFNNAFEKNSKAYPNYILPRQPDADNKRAGIFRGRYTSCLTAANENRGKAHGRLVFENTFFF